MIKIQIKSLPNSPALESVADARTRTELMKINENVKSVRGQLTECQHAVLELQRNGNKSSVTSSETPEVPDIDVEELTALVARAESAANESTQSATAAAGAATNALDSANSAIASSESAGSFSESAGVSASAAEAAAARAEAAADSIVGTFRPFTYTIGGDMGSSSGISPSLSGYYTFNLKDLGADESKTYQIIVHAWGWEDVEEKYSSGYVYISIDGAIKNFYVQGNDSDGDLVRTYEVDGGSTVVCWTTEVWLSATVMIKEIS